MKILRLVLILGGLSIAVWGVSDYFNTSIEDTSQALPKIILGLLGSLMAVLAKSRR